MYVCTTFVVNKRIHYFQLILSTGSICIQCWGGISAEGIKIEKDGDRSLGEETLQPFQPIRGSGEVS